MRTVSSSASFKQQVRTYDVPRRQSLFQFFSNPLIPFQPISPPIPRRTEALPRPDLEARKVIHRNDLDLVPRAVRLRLWPDQGMCARGTAEGPFREEWGSSWALCSAGPELMVISDVGEEAEGRERTM
jgi:hypothetical protein